MKEEYQTPRMRVDVIEEEDVVTGSAVVPDEDEMPVLPFPFSTDNSAESYESFLY